MRDARLAELELLTTLERDGEMRVRIGKGSNEERFGLAAGAVREMIYELIASGLVNGPTHALDDDRAKQDWAHDIERLHRLTDLNGLRLGQSIAIRINHRGRLRLWQLRDELRADRGREQFGVLLDKRTWDRDLAVAVLFASEEAPLAVFYLDLDNFKSVNDTRGHDAGDAVLRRYLEIVRDTVGDAGEAYRLGGDEVTALVAGVTAGDAAAMAERIRVGIETEFRDQPEPRPTASVGVGVFSHPIAPLVASKFADDQMYAAKKEGKNCVICKAQKL